MNSATLIKPEQHCIAWARATASLWGNCRDHDLDEPICLTETAPVRIRLAPGRDLAVLIDRPLSLKTLRAGTHTYLRFTFETGKFFEIAVDGLASVNHGETAEVRP